ncbi:MAG: glycosyltransferase [Microcoleaceae cyanobacterium]
MYWITVNYHSTQLIQKLIHSISIQHQTDNRLIIINNSPQDASIYQLKSDFIMILDAPGNLGFGGGCNIGLNWVYKQDKNAIVWLINPDTQLPQNAISNAINITRQYPHLSIIGTLVEQADQSIGLGGGLFNPKTGEILPQIYRELCHDQSLIAIDWVSGCSMILNLRHFTTCPQFDIDYFLYYEDFDFCLRYRQQGHQLAITPNIKIFHQSSSITNQYPRLKLESQIYSYLLSLEKYASPAAFLYRLIRISLVSLIFILINPQISLPKLKGVIRYWKRILYS